MSQAIANHRKLAAMERRHTGSFRLAVDAGTLPELMLTPGLALLSARERPNPRIRLEFTRHPNLVAPALAAAIENCANGMSPWPLVLLGPAGCGKTCAALALADRVDGKVIYRDFGALCELVRKAKMGELVVYGSHAETVVFPEDWWREWAGVELAVVDEVGMRDSISDHQFETLKTAIDRRQNKPLVVISNLALPRLARLFDDRIVSRLAGGTVVNIEGLDRRLQPPSGAVLSEHAEKDAAMSSTGPPHVPPRSQGELANV